jgi:peptidoglycan/xylan/chitin deacetylase (PgdA/CDA1 family)
MILNPPPWPNGARCAVAFTYDMDADSILHYDHHASADTRVAAMSMLRYGPEVAVPRILAMYRQFGMRQTFFLPAWCMERYPAAVEAILKDGHEIGHHGYLHERPNELPPDKEMYWLQRATEVMVQMTGKRPRGIRCGSYKFSRHTFAFLVQEGFDYDASLFGDDVPYVLKSDAGSIVELPSHYGMDDWPHYMASRDFGYMMSIKSARASLELFMEEFDAVWECGGLWIAVWHPFLSGRLARARATQRLIAYMHQKGQVWFATLEDISAHIRTLMAEGRWQPRVDPFPYYEGPIPELGEQSPELVK